MRVTHTFLLVAFVLCASSVCYAENDIPVPFFGYSGNWDSAGDTYVPDIDDEGNCSLADSTNKYATFNLTFTSNGVRRFSSFEGFQYVFLYKAGTFNASNPCASNFTYLYNEIGGGDIDDGETAYAYDSFWYFQGGVPYTFVLVGYESRGSFTGQITQGTMGATSNNTSPTWTPVYLDNTGACVPIPAEDATSTYYYNQSLVSVATTGWYDIMAYFAEGPNGEYPENTYMALYQGVPNASVSTNACNATGDNGAVTLLQAVYGPYEYVEIIQVHLVAGVQYSIVFSPYTESDPFWGPFGWEIQTTRRFNFTLPVSTTSITTGGFTEPPRDDDHYGVPGLYCIPNQDSSGEYNNVAYAVVTWDMPSKWNFTTYFSQAPNDYAFFVYGGENINPPTPCFTGGSYLYWSDEEDFTYGGSPYNNYSNFTIVATPWNDGYTPTTAWYTDAYVTYGAPITSGAPIPVTTTTTTTTLSPNTTTTTTKSPVTTTTTLSPNTTTTTTKAPNTTTTTTTTKAPSSTTSKSTTASSSTSTSAGSVGASVAGAVILAAALLAAF